MTHESFGSQTRLAALAAGLALILLLGACAGPGGGTASRGGGAADGGAAAPGGGRGGGYYLDDGPGRHPPPDIAAIPDAVPRAEPVLARTSRPYVVFGREYRPMSRLEPYKARGVATWYGRRYHGNPTSSGERYDMYGMTAAHPTLPIPSYVRVTHVANGRSVVVRVNDRGPFLHDRLIDLSYTAAAKLGYVQAGTAEVEVELITEFGEPARAPRLLAASGDRPVDRAPAEAAPAVTAVAPRTEPIRVETSASPAQPAPERLQVETELVGAAAPVVGLSQPGAAEGRPQPAPGGRMEIPVLERGYWLQLGAFGSAVNASAARERLAERITGLGAPIDVIADGGLFKLQAGPWPTPEAAQAAAERIRATTELEPFATRR